MVNSIYRFLISFDAFGKPISVNFKGEQSYKTACGAFFTFAIKGFLLLYLMLAFLGLTGYKDPQIIQYTVYDPRVSGDEVNFGDSRGALMFSLMDSNTAYFIRNDPSMLSFSIELLNHEFKDNEIIFNTEIDGETEFVSK